MSNYTNTNVMHRLSVPFRYLLWTLDEFAAAFIPIVIGVLVGELLLSLFVGMALVFALRWFKKKIGGVGSLNQLRYWLSPKKGMPPSSIKEYLS